MPFRRWTSTMSMPLQGQLSPELRGRTLRICHGEFLRGLSGPASVGKRLMFLATPGLHSLCPSVTGVSPHQMSFACFYEDACGSRGPWATRATAASCTPFAPRHRLPARHVLGHCAREVWQHSSIGLVLCPLHRRVLDACSDAPGSEGTANSEACSWRS